MNKKDTRSSLPLLRLQNIKRTYVQGTSSLEILQNVSFDLQPGEIIALVGPSGSGKSTLLHIAGLLERPSEGEIWIEGKSCHTLSDDQRTALRRHTIGFVYQFHHLLPEFTALENVLLPQMIAGIEESKAFQRSSELLKRLNLLDRASHRPNKLSGGEQQRVALLRALANHPKILLADEPTGNLDEKTAEQVFKELLMIVRDQKMTALIATHDITLARRMDRLLTLQAGKVVEIKN